MSKEQIRCRDCEFLKCVGTSLKPYGSRLSYYCEHKNQEYIRRYFDEHKLKKIPGFVCFSIGMYYEPSIKTSPPWCPKKRKRAMRNERQ